MAIDVTLYPRVKIELDLDDRQASDLWQAIGEAFSLVGNWRSDPSTLRELGDAVKAAMSPKPQKYDGAPAAPAVPFLWDGPGPPPPWYPPPAETAESLALRDAMPCGICGVPRGEHGSPITDRDAKTHHRWVPPEKVTP